MRIYIVCIVLLICSSALQAQFVLTADGLISSQDNTKSFAVYKFKGLMQNYLFSRVLPFVKENFNPEDYITKEVPEQIFIDGKAIDRIGPGAIKGDILYRLSIGIEDGKLEYEIQKLGFSNASLIEPSTAPVHSDDPGAVRYYIFDRNGQLYSNELKTQVEEYFNAIVNSINSYIRDTANVSWEL